MKQRTSYKLVVYLDIIQDLPDESTQQNVIDDCDNIQLNLERETVKTLTEDYGYNCKIVINKLPEFISVNTCPVS